MKTQQTTICEVNLIYRRKVKASDRPQVKCSRDECKLFIESWNLGTIEFVEEFKILLLNRSNNISKLIIQSPFKALYNLKISKLT